MAKKKTVKKETESVSLLDAVIKKWSKESTILSLREMDDSQRTAFSSGSLSLDYLINPDVGGMFCGQVLEMWGGFSAGKTTLALGFCLNAVANGKQVIYIDTEGSLGSKLLNNTGMNRDLFIWNLESDGRVSANFAEDVIKSGDCGILVIDTVAMWKPMVDSTKSTKTEDIDITAVKMAEQSQFLTQVLSHLARIAREHNVMILILNQERTKIGGWGYPGKPSGGKIIEHVDAVRIQLSGNPAVKKHQIHDYLGRKVGQFTTALCDKNKLNIPMKSVEIPLFFAKGCNPYMEVALLALRLGIVHVESGSMYRDSNGNTIARGQEEYYATLDRDEDTYKRLRSEVIEKLEIKYPPGMKIVNAFHDENFVRNEVFDVSYDLLGPKDK